MRADCSILSYGAVSDNICVDLSIHQYVNRFPLSSFDYIVEMSILKIECEDFKSKKKCINLSIDTLISTFASPQMY